MTRYETLKEKAQKCREAAKKTTGKMRKIWLIKAADLEAMAANLPLVKAAELEA